MPKITAADFYDFAAAQAQGWFISHAAGNGDGTTWRLERDDAGPLASDPQAHEYVVKAASTGDANAHRALQFLAMFEPRELAIVEQNAADAGVWDDADESPWAYEWGTVAQEKLAAIRARIAGCWDHPALMQYGPLSDTPTLDVMYIINVTPPALQAYCDAAEAHNAAPDLCPACHQNEADSGVPIPRKVTCPGCVAAMGETIADLEKEPAPAPQGNPYAGRLIECTRYLVDGLAIDGCGNWESGPGTFPPFVVFDSERQENLPGYYAVREHAQIVADGLNARDA